MYIKLITIRFFAVLFIWVLSVTVSIGVLKGQVVINEVMSGGNTLHSDNSGQFHDWIELYNSGDVEVNMNGYCLSDDGSKLRKWCFGDLTIKAQEYVVVFASGLDRNEGEEQHTNFKIKQDGEPLQLCNQHGQIISQLVSVYIPDNKSFAAIPDGSELHVICNEPTPGKSNNGTGGIYCSHETGFYNKGFALTISSGSPDEDIRYTLDGSAPNRLSPRMTEPLWVDSETHTKANLSNIPTTPLKGEDQLYDFIWKKPEYVFKGTVVQYAAFNRIGQSSPRYAKTYFFDSDSKIKYSMPVLSLVVDSSSLFDYDTGIYVPGRKFDEEGFNWWPSGNYHNRGSKWERNVHVTYLDKNGQIIFETNAGIRMRGLGSCSYPQKSLNIYFRKEYGRNRVDYDFFDSGVDKYKRLILRNAGNDFLKSHFKDAFLHSVFGTMDVETQLSNPGIVFINGEYWGIHNLREKYDKYYFKYKFGIHEDDINLLGVCGVVEEGSNSDYRTLIDFITQNDISEISTFEELSGYIDIQNFIDYNIAEIYFANYDWPCNNYKLWKTNKPESKWRHLIYDLDVSFGYDNSSSFQTNSFEHAFGIGNDWPHCDCSNFLWRELSKSPLFVEKFLSRFAYHLETTFHPNRMNQLIDKLENAYSSEIEAHIARWQYPASKKAWLDEVNQLRLFAEERPCYVSSQIMNYFNLQEYDFDCLITNDESQNKLLLFPNPGAGDFYIYNGFSEPVKDGKLSIFDAMGQLVIPDSLVNLEPKQRSRIINTNLLPGIYVLQLTYGGKVQTWKVIVK